MLAMSYCWETQAAVKVMFPSSSLSAVRAGGKPIPINI